MITIIDLRIKNQFFLKSVEPFSLFFLQPYNFYHKNKILYDGVVTTPKSHQLDRGLLLPVVLFFGIRISRVIKKNKTTL